MESGAAARKSSFRILRKKAPDQGVVGAMAAPETWELVAHIEAKSAIDAIRQYASNPPAGAETAAGQYVAVVDVSWNVKELKPRQGFDLV